MDVIKVNAAPASGMFDGMFDNELSNISGTES